VDSHNSEEKEGKMVSTLEKGRHKINGLSLQPGLITLGGKRLRNRGGRLGREPFPHMTPSGVGFIKKDECGDPYCLVALFCAW